MRNKSRTWLTAMLVLVVLLLAAALLALGVGETGVAPADILPLILNGAGTPERSILLDIRLPRILLGLAVGGSLSIAGVMLQGLFRNPLVEPYTLGISGGAALGVCLGIAGGLTALAGTYTLPLFGLLGALAVILFLQFLGSRQLVAGIQGLLLAGVMTNFIASSAVLLIMSISRAEDLQGILFWIIGSLAETDWLLVELALAVAGAGLAASYAYCHDLNGMALGEEEALHLGIDVEKTKHALFALASVLTGVCVALTGTIGFVGLVVPHFLRLVVGGDHRILLAASFLAGGIFLVFCDTVAKTIAFPVELPAGVVTGILGGTLFIYTLAKREASLRKG